ncbi:MAG TPA: sulfatase-like hydrolase/transferase [Planctomycetota bacterium]|nr:sulfatase-like hydrolase/transferase [Planctomycetota bacterium]HRR81651.1 sulfatase-like hydrolase/transferase [Planctomycetota bacterium]HRT95409.1 sulfatase-like hydrolase/transferase [Planctomycetota bacterium]
MAKPRADKPNVIVFFTDQQRWDGSGLFGNPLDLTPNYDRVATQGTHCQFGFTCQPVCAPARSVLQTGLYATATGTWRNGIPLRRGLRTLAHHFNDAGYHTGYIGKWHLASQSVVPPDERGGYQYWLGADVLEFCSDAYDCVMYDGDGREVKLPGYRVDAQTDAAIRYVDAHQHEPFFLFLSYLEPHFQNHLDDYPPPDGYRERYTGRWVPADLAALGGSTHAHLGGYWGMIKRLDEAFGRLLDALRSLGLAENTIVLFTSDHGCHFKTRNSEYKRSCHESSIRIPMALTGPGFFGGGCLRQLVSLVDMPPTLLDAAGIPVPREMQGRSILPLTKGATQDWPEEVFVQISEAQVARCVRTRRWKYSVSAPDKKGWTDSASDRYVEEFLYDLQADPHELDNRIHLESHRKVADVMRARLVRRMVAAGEAAPVIEPVAARAGGQKRVTPEEARQ